jgi:hypothetical protein
MIKGEMVYIFHARACANSAIELKTLPDCRVSMVG